MLLCLLCGRSISSCPFINTLHFDSTPGSLPPAFPEILPCTTDPATVGSVTLSHHDKCMGRTAAGTRAPFRRLSSQEVLPAKDLSGSTPPLSAILPRDKMNTLIVAILSCRSPRKIWPLSAEGFNKPPWWPFTLSVLRIFSPTCLLVHQYSDTLSGVFHRLINSPLFSILHGMASRLDASEYAEAWLSLWCNCITVFSLENQTSLGQLAETGVVSSITLWKFVKKNLCLDRVQLLLHHRKSWRPDARKDLLLPKYQPWDCAIDLLLAATSRSRVYHIFQCLKMWWWRNTRRFTSKYVQIDALFYIPANRIRTQIDLLVVSEHVLSPLCIIPLLQWDIMEDPE